MPVRARLAYVAVGNSPCGKQSGSFLQNSACTHRVTQQPHPCTSIPEKWRCAVTQVHSVVLNSRILETTPMPFGGWVGERPLHTGMFVQWSTTQRQQGASDLGDSPRSYGERKKTFLKSYVIPFIYLLEKAKTVEMKNRWPAVRGAGRVQYNTK